MSKGIKISPKHGLNPCIPVCIFCGKQKNEIAALGMLKGDAEAPMSAVINYDPCDECLANWEMGVALIRVSRKPPQEGMPPIQVSGSDRLYPTAQYTVITPDAAKRIFGIESENGGRILVEDNMFDQFMSDLKAQGMIDENGEVVHEDN